MKWTKINGDNLPKAGIPVLAFGKNEYDKGRTIRAFYAPRHTIQDDNDYEAAEYCEEKDEYFLREGWYEQNECEEVNWFVTFAVTHWMPLPEHPIQDCIGNEDHLTVH